MKIVIDVETGGLDPERFSILEFAAVNYENLEHFSTYVIEPEIVVNAGAMLVNKISLERLAEEGVSPALAVNTFDRWLERQGFSGKGQLEPIGHNVDFDLRFVERMYRFASGGTCEFNRLWSYRKRDTRTIIQFLDDSEAFKIKNKTLKDICEFFGIEMDGEHTALGDALATAKLYRSLVAYARPESLDRM